MGRTTRILLSCALIAGVLAIDVPGASAVSTGRNRLLSYKGHTSQELPVRFLVDRPATGQRSVLRVDFSARVVCEDASVERWGVGIGYGRRGLPMDADHRFSDDQNYPGEFQLLFSGRLGSRRGRGLVELNVFQTAAGEFQDCTSGERTWRARKTRSRWARSEPALDAMVRVTVAPDGTGAATIVRD